MLQDCKDGATSEPKTHTEYTHENMRRSSSLVPNGMNDVNDECNPKGDGAKDAQTEIGPVVV